MVLDKLEIIEKAVILSPPIGASSTDYDGPEREFSGDEGVSVTYETVNEGSFGNGTGGGVDVTSVERNVGKINKGVDKDVKEVKGNRIYTFYKRQN